MTVAELIAALQQFSGETRVLVSGYEGGMDDPCPPVLVCDVETQAHRECFGTYQVGGDYGDAAPVPVFDAVVITR